jgi:hypothetical protein
MWVSGFIPTRSSKKLPRQTNPSGNDGIALKYIGKLYKIEKEARLEELPPDQLYAQRQFTAWLKLLKPMVLTPISIWNILFEHVPEAMVTEDFEALLPHNVDKGILAVRWSPKNEQCAKLLVNPNERNWKRVEKENCTARNLKQKLPCQP